MVDGREAERGAGAGGTGDATGATGAEASAIGGVTGRTAAGVAGRSGTLGSGTAVISPVLRETRATTPGVNVGVGFLRCGGGENGVANGIDGLDIAGVGDRGTSIERRGGGGSNASGAASASDSMTARSLAAHADSAAVTGATADAASGIGIAAEPRAGVGPGAPSMPTRITAPQTEQRARTPPGGTLAGSTRNTD